MRSVNNQRIKIVGIMSNHIQDKAANREFVMKVGHGHMLEFHKALVEAANNYNYKGMIGKQFYVFTNWGLVKATVVKERTDNKTGLFQYKLKIDIDKNNKGKDYGFWFNTNQLHKSKVKALFSELIK